MTWLYVIIIVAVIGGVIGWLSSKGGEKGEGFMTGFFGAGTGCGFVVLQIGLGLLSLYLLVKLGMWLFG